MSKADETPKPATGRALLKVAAMAACAIGLGALAYLLSGGFSAAQPPIVLITLDTTRADHLGCYGHTHPASPRIDEFAEQAVVWDRAITTGTWTLPSHASLFTGKFPTSHGAEKDPEGSLKLTTGITGPSPWQEIRTNTISVEERTLADILRSNGYATGAVVAGPWMKRLFGLSRGFDFYDDTNITSLNGRPAADVTDSALAWLDETTDRTPFLFLNYFDPHGPLLPPEPYLRTFLPNGIGDPENPTHAETHALYDAEILYMDEHVGRLLDGLKQRGLYDDAWIIVTADHGELLGEHDLSGHGSYPYQEVVRIPLIVKEPGGRTSPDRRGEWVQLVDVMPSLLVSLGIAVPENIQGEVVPQITHPIVVESRVLPAFEPGGHWLAVIEGDMKLLLNSTGKHMLFNLREDPKEEHDLLPASAAVARSMQSRLKSYLASLPEPGPQGPVRQVDPQTEEMLRGLGYLE